MAILILLILYANQVKMKVYVDERGFLHAEVPNRGEILGDFLSGDIQ